MFFDSKSSMRVAARAALCPAAFFIAACGSGSLTGPASQEATATSAQEATSASTTSSAGTGSFAIEVVTVTTGLPTDPDGYILTVDGDYAAALGVSESRIIDGLVGATHEVALSEVAENCAVQGGNAQQEKRRLRVEPPIGRGEKIRSEQNAAACCGL